MSFKDYEKALKLIETGKEITCFIGGASDILIKNAEERLNLSFSKIYKDFLLRFGAMSFGTEEFYGIVNENFDNSRIPDAIWYTLEERKKVNLPDHLLVFYDTGSEELFCLDFNKLNFDGEPKVVVFVPGVDLQYQSYEVISNDFGEFLLQKVKLELENS